MDLRDQIREAAVLLAIIAISAPLLFCLADWVRYGSEPGWFIFGLAIGGIVGASLGALLIACMIGAADRRYLP